MRANILRGKLIAPKTLRAGMERQKHLAYEIRRIEAQIADPFRPPAPTEIEEITTYHAWRQSAERALNLFKLELRLLDEWVDVRQNDSERLLRQAYEALKVLEVQVDFESHETALMEKLDSFFDHTRAS